ncbi:MAG: hypothetical protein IPJ16_16595 [Bacteroidales bacterium]|nr:hypothetical protein [Bacteroidales bacterium]
MENEIGETARLNSEKMVKKSKMIIKNSVLSTKGPGQRRKVSTKKRKIYPIPEEDTFMPIDEDSEEIKYTTKKNIS